GAVGDREIQVKAAEIGQKSNEYLAQREEQKIGAAMEKIEATVKSGDKVSVNENKEVQAQAGEVKAALEARQERVKETGGKLTDKETAMLTTATALAAPKGEESVGKIEDNARQLVEQNKARTQEKAVSQPTQETTLRGGEMPPAAAKPKASTQAPDA